jgi:hypothetical protein
MAMAKRRRYKGNGKNPPVNGNGGNDPTEAVFRVDLATGIMRITDQKGDVIKEDPVTAEKIAKYGIKAEGELLAIIFYATCNIKHGGCVIKIVKGREVLVW